MSREGFSDFLHAAEHSSSLRRELRKCINYQSVLKLAANYGFHITKQDLENDEKAIELSDWFKTSKINPIRKSSF